MGGPPVHLSRPRAAAVRALAEILAGAEMDAALGAARARAPARSGPLVQELVYGVLRHYRELAARRAALLARPRDPVPEPVALAIAVALYELAALATPPHAAVHEAVECVRDLDAPWAARLVNAVLRRALREGCRPLAADPRGEYPAWLQRRIDADWGEAAALVYAGGVARAPLALRVNRLRAEREGYLARLASAGIAARRGEHCADAVVLAEPRPLASVPGFSEGLVSVQDEAAQLAAPLLAPEPGDRVLDACAAPGGKACHVLECCPGLGRLVALDRSGRRLADVAANLSRLGLGAELVVGDALRPRDWWDGAPFERILLDAPCTATGVMRRHPDIRIARRAAHAAHAARRQGALLAALWPLLAPGGRLVYSTCSVLRTENDRVVRAFLEATPDARELAVQAGWGRRLGPGRQILPGEADMDGFYYAVIIKR